MHFIHAFPKNSVLCHAPKLLERDSAHSCLGSFATGTDSHTPSSYLGKTLSFTCFSNQPDYIHRFVSK
jgi:hypothetical protein